MVSVFVDPGAAEKDPFIVRPEETYHSPYPSNTLINLRIATGGAGQSGLIRALADTFIADTCSDDKEAPFGVAWLKSDISTSFNYLAQNAADVSITYHTVAEDIAIQQGIVERRLYAWRDHWMLVGPASNPAALPYPPDPDRTVHTLFGYIFRAAIRSQGSSNPVRFLSRWDKSACNIKESFIWTSIGMVPWAEPKSEWYHTCMADPFTALRIATENGEYTLTDRGTWIASGAEKAEMRVYMEGKDGEDEVLLNPAHILVGKYGANRKIAEKFADWMGRRGGAQEVVSGFAVDGRVLYTMAPEKERAEELRGFA